MEHAVTGIRHSSDLHWIQALGIVDNDRRPKEELDELKAKGIYAVPFYSVESIYYHPEIQARIARGQEKTYGTETAKYLNDAKAAALAAVKPHAPRLSARVAEKAVREALLKHLPKQKDIANGKPIKADIDVATMVRDEQKRLEDAIASENLEKIIAGYPVRDTPALDKIAESLDFPNRRKYEMAVRQLLKDDSEALEFVRGLFGNLTYELDAK